MDVFSGDPVVSLTVSISCLFAPYQRSPREHARWSVDAVLLPRDV